jgi:hypothetical protein
MSDSVRSKEQMPARFALPAGAAVPPARDQPRRGNSSGGAAGRRTPDAQSLRLRDLIFADNSPGTALGLLLFGFVVTFGSAAMGTAIMAMGRPPADDETPRGPPRLAA